MAGPHTAGCLAPHFLRQWLTSAIPALTPESCQSFHGTDVFPFHWRAMPTTLDEAPPFFRSFYKFSFSLLWKVNKLYRYLFYLINSHILIHRVVKKKCFFLSSLIIVPPNYIHFPKVIYSTSGGRRDYFSPHSADYSFITVSGDGKQRGLVTEPE